ncbi:TetR/AcrR family transcriptional regulator [Roseibacillus ishigakijimensis]|uniref:TetR/AcrR family transcriptional regulator n=1 Tax=Roseibacillus ishigakijimensis TaxID=454146 RepID=A0A934VMG5_9BACT|nr:TetR/AcrR family transcriptional regulator [Roseibacillus ishigakijimensis]MBK1833930.1 TetR/AcrR family transcriptional regulator [Roseibacillus ishigakijimensis]
MDRANEKQETQERLLDAAEELFAEKGFESVSLREITAAAGANVAAVNYHFGSKENLINAVIKRHVLPANRERMARLKELLAQEKPPQVREVVEAFLRPLIERVCERKFRQRLFARFKSRMVGEGAACLPSEVLVDFQKMMRQVVVALQVAVPGLSEERAYLQLKFCFAVMADALTPDEAFSQIAEGHGQENWSLEELLDEVLNFCEGGLRA